MSEPIYPRLTLAGLLAAALALLCVPEADVQSLRGFTLSAYRPLLSLFTPASNRTVSASLQQPAETQEPVVNALDLQARNEELRHENRRLLEELKTYRAMLDAGTLPNAAAKLAGLPARIMARETRGHELLFGLDRGTSQGVKRGAGVLFRGAAVGRIVAAGNEAASMAPITHAGLRVAARLAESRHDGVLQGGMSAGTRVCRMKIVGREIHAREGEIVVTSGLDQAFPAGCVLGSVIKIERSGEMEWTVEVQPVYDAEQLEAVYVLQPRAVEIPWPGK